MVDFFNLWALPIAYLLNTNFEDNATREQTEREGGRDRQTDRQRGRERERRRERGKEGDRGGAVSYTHLTLPTKLSV